MVAAADRGAMTARSSGVGAASTGVVVAVAVGGVLGALARYAVGSGWPGGQAVPWSTLLINVTGCLLLGMVAVILERRSAPPWVHPFIAVGVLGGFTTFSAVAGETLQLLQDGRVLMALTYWVGTVVAALVGTVVGMAGARRVLR